MLNIIKRIEWIKIPPLDDKIKPYYYISNTGLVYSIYSNNFIIPHINHAGYLQVSLMTEEIHSICRYYEIYKSLYNGYGSVKQIAIDALKNINLPITDTYIRLAKRLYYKYDNKEICNLYNY